jgi:hypothetical protein
MESECEVMRRGAFVGSRTGRGGRATATDKQRCPDRRVREVKRGPLD